MSLFAYDDSGIEVNKHDAIQHESVSVRRRLTPSYSPTQALFEPSSLQLTRLPSIIIVTSLPVKSASPSSHRDERDTGTVYVIISVVFIGVCFIYFLLLYCSKIRTPEATTTTISLEYQPASFVPNPSVGVSYPCIEASYPSAVAVRQSENIQFVQASRVTE